MPSRPRSSRKPKPKKDSGPVLIGPERPPTITQPRQPTIPDPSRLPAGEAGEATQVEATEDLGGQQRSGGRRKRIYKKFKGGDGWGEGFVETAPHEADLDRYDSALPYDQRMLRANDEFRSLRALPLDRRLAVDSMLKDHFELDNTLLRQKYGRQGLRGVTFDEPEESDEEEVDSDAEEGQPDEPAEKISELEEIPESVWAQEKFDDRLIAIWLDDRANDGYTPILTAAPQVMGNFLRFLVTRNVFPQYNRQIKSAAAVCEHAKLQRALAKQLPTPFHKALLALFPSPTSELVSPIPEHDKPVEPAAPTIPELIPAADFVATTTDEDLDVDTYPIDEGWPAAEGEEVNSAVEEQKRKIEAIQKAWEQQAHTAENWKEHQIKEEDATAEVKAVLKRLGRNVELEGSWKVESMERSARAILGWERIDDGAPSKAAAAEEPKAQRSLIRISLSAHLPAFPVTPFSHSSSTASEGAPRAPTTLDSPIALYLDLAPSALKQLGPSPGMVLETDFTKISFSSRTANQPIWMLRSIHRILPSYWAKIGEALRNEPGRQRDFEGEWEVPHGFERHWEERLGQAAPTASTEEHADGEQVKVEAEAQQHSAGSEEK